MAEVVIISTLLVVGFALGFAATSYWREKNIRRMSESTTSIGDDYLYECFVCGEERSDDEIHRIIETFDDDGALLSEAAPGAGGGTAMIDEFCEEHCPGGCDKEPHKVAV